VSVVNTIMYLSILLDYAHTQLISSIHECQLTTYNKVNQQLPYL